MGTFKKYITVIELPHKGVTKKLQLVGKDKQPFAMIRWYGGWRKYVCEFYGDSFIDSDVAREIAEMLYQLNQTHYGKDTRIRDGEN